MNNQNCKYCGLNFPGIIGRVFSNHVRWCESNPNRNNTKAISEASKRSNDRRLCFKKEFAVNCHKCGIIFNVTEREKLHPIKDRYYCSIYCCHSRQHSEDQKAKISKTLTGRKIVERQDRVCLHCNKVFEERITSNQKFCSKNCFYENSKSDDEFLVYKSSCKFKFNVWKFPKEFDLDLIKKHGWYSASNRGNNLGGVSRDHCISIRFGWDNNIPPDLMSHPANCRLMVHSDNISKNRKCSLVLEDLIENVKKWDEIYKDI